MVRGMSYLPLDADDALRQLVEYWWEGFKHCRDDHVYSYGLQRYSKFTVTYNGVEIKEKK